MPDTTTHKERTMTLHEIEDMNFTFGPRLWDADPDVCCAAFQLGACAHTEAPIDDEMADQGDVYGDDEIDDEMADQGDVYGDDEPF